MGRIGRAALCALVGAVLLAGCAVVEPGKAVPNAQEVERLARPLTSKAVLGDLATVDYCTLLDLGALGDVRLERVRPDFAACMAEVTAAEGRVLLGIGHLSEAPTSVLGQPPDETVSLPHGWKVERFDGLEPGVCYRFLEFSDGVSLQVHATYPEGYPVVPSAALCRLADATIDGVRSWLTTRRVGRLTFREESLGRLDACVLVPEAEVEAALGGAAPVSPEPTGHLCGWGSRWDEPGPAAFLEFAIQELGDADEFAETIGGRPSRVTPLDGGSCLVETPHVHFSATKPYDREFARVEVRPAGGDACAAARALAERIWPALPARPE
ncbi:hypothetical protein SAMN05421810_101411 [Amycolatopsis arida]|uniref:Uncharacterized protein n=1 Tax=Amycolatopsis arida TaxID=587909 RepID=A0A1I5L5Q5_9PSEU|nr:hypothetical protein [Amycolatopsis arida]TDX93589.1 hypothetical protein CLV69_10444 [Amycolatopsis arida]SFO92502.1 hypothetical protein SAMN05421810_101411 [Amycolatopsis arida]